ncbi:GNAT family N-acetyltransferase [Trichocoleus sp. FACHB-591]|uniref:GNAT family N-acetyltransferase n=1 Tax=Trichocoleus sp. FACHB-591 TaxID=2692872 RepID=UPI0016826B44|nr:GNAT family N-acetyltransferase [Trichocoleus sp. FACHB-591]MBD2099200.1 GNAT family N-acetyltransferase [Trichocoleus sp. FACHB-591]
MTVFETPRLLLRQFTQDDVDDLAAMYADPAVMTYLGGVRSYETTQQHIERIIQNYQDYGFGLWAVIHKGDRRLMGRCGLIPQTIEGQGEVEIGYLLSHAYWGQGLATEAATAIRDYGFNTVGCDRLISLIDPHNLASQKVALRVGLTYEKDVILSDKPIRLYAIYRPADS